MRDSSLGNWMNHVNWDQDTIKKDDIFLELAKKKLEIEEKWVKSLEEKSDYPLETRPKIKEFDRAKEIVVMLSDDWAAEWKWNQESDFEMSHDLNN